MALKLKWAKSKAKSSYLLSYLTSELKRSLNRNPKRNLIITINGGIRSRMADGVFRFVLVLYIVGTLYGPKKLHKKNIY